MPLEGQSPSSYINRRRREFRDILSEMDAASASCHNKLGLGLRDQWTILDEWAALVRPALERAEWAEMLFESEETAWRDRPVVREQLLSAIRECVEAYAEFLRQYDFHRFLGDDIASFVTWNTIVVASMRLKIVMRRVSRRWCMCSTRTRRIYADAARLCGRFGMLMDYLN